MNNKKKNTFLVITGAVILGVFIAVSMINIPFANSEEYMLSTDIVHSVDYSDGKIFISTRDSIVSVCIKPTKSEPSKDSLCWIEGDNNIYSTSIYENKTYYIWIKDDNSNVIYYSKYNTQELE